MHACTRLPATDVDECLHNNGGCHSERTCTNTDGGRTCEDCATGWANDGDAGCLGLCEGAVRVR